MLSYQYAPEVSQFSTNGKKEMIFIHIAQKASGTTGRTGTVTLTNYFLTAFKTITISFRQDDGTTTLTPNTNL